MLQEHQLYANLSKCDSYKPHIQYLGHIISETRIDVDLEKNKYIKYWPTPTNVSEIRYILGLVKYYRKFIENLSRIDCLITVLQKKENNLFWTTKCEESFQNLK